MITATPEGIRNLLLDLVRQKSISTTAEEKRIACDIARRLAELPYFETRPELLQLVDLPKDPFGRKAVAALVRAEPETSKTLILIGHLDVVDVDAYANLRHAAFDPEQLPSLLDAEDLTPEVRRDLESGNFLFGRGVMDMKCGVAIEMALLAEAAENPGSLEANLLFLGVPDEENNSEGMRGVLPYLRELRQREGLDYLVCCNTEPSDPAFNNGRPRTLYLGSCGKIMPVFLCVGRSAHVGQFFEGFSGALIAAEINRAMEGNPDLAEALGDEHFAPPTCLGFKDLRDVYSVTLSGMAATWFNVTVIEKTPRRVLEEMRAVAQGALEQAVAHLMGRRATYAKNMGEPLEDPRWQAKVFSLEEVRRMLPPSWKGEPAPSGDERERAVALASQMVADAGIEGPAVVVGFLPPYYPPRVGRGTSAREQAVQQAVREVAEEAHRDFGETLDVIRCFGGITDMSWCGFQGKREELEPLLDNMPGWETLFPFPLDELLELDIPVANIGPAGRDAHKKTERLELDYSLRVAPELLRRFLRKVAALPAEGVKTKEE